MPYTQTTSWGHLGTRNPAQFALMNPAEFAGQEVYVDLGVTLASYFSDGASWVTSNGGQIALSASNNDALRNTQRVQSVFDSGLSVYLTEPGVYVFDTTLSPILIPHKSVLYKGAGVTLKVADGCPSALITNHTARSEGVTVLAGNCTYATAPDGNNFCAVISGLSALDLLKFPVGSWISAVIHGHLNGTSFNHRGYRGVHQVLENNGVTLKYQIDKVYPGTDFSTIPFKLYQVTENPQVLGPGTIDGNGANADVRYQTGDPRGVVIWWRHCTDPVVEAGVLKRGITWTLGQNYVRNSRYRDMVPDLKNTPGFSAVDFIHVSGQAQGVLVETNNGAVGDNYVGLTIDITDDVANSWSAAGNTPGNPNFSQVWNYDNNPASPGLGTFRYNFPFQDPGDMYDIRIVNNNGDCVSEDGSFGVVGIYGPPSYRFGSITVQDLGGNGSSGVQISNYAFTGMNNPQIDSLRVIRTKVVASSAQVEITPGAYTINQLILEDTSATRDDVQVLNISTSAVGNIRSLQLKRLATEPYNGVTFVRTAPIATFGGINIGALAIDGSEGIELAANVRAFLSNGSGNIGKVGISNCSATGTGTAALWGDTGAGAAAAPVYFNSRYNGAPL